MGRARKVSTLRAVAVRFLAGRGLGRLGLMKRACWGSYLRLRAFVTILPWQRPHHIQPRLDLSASSRQFRSYADTATIQGGDWETGDLSKVGDFTSVRGLIQHFVDGRPWEETVLYSFLIERLDSGEPVWGCRTVADVWARLQRIDALHESIRRRGYRSRRALDDRGATVTNEVSLVIARDGRLLFADGRHRLVLACILGVETLPVQIASVHEEWYDRYRRRLRGEGLSLLPHRWACATGRVSWDRVLGPSMNALPAATSHRGPMKQLEELAVLLDDAGLTWWAGYGTLLGLIREERILPWDRDIDLDCWAEDAGWDALALSLNAAGYRVRPHVFRGMLYKYRLVPDDGLPVDIHIWRRHGVSAWHPSPKALPSPYPRRSVRRALYGAVRKPVGQVWRRTTLLNRHEGVERALERLGLVINTWTVPAELLEVTERRAFQELEIPVPARAEELLALKYGNWRRPRQSWSSMHDDPTYRRERPPASLERTPPLMSRRSRG